MKKLLAMGMVGMLATATSSFGMLVKDPKSLILQPKGEPEPWDLEHPEPTDFQKDRPTLIKCEKRPFDKRGVLILVQFALVGIPSASINITNTSMELKDVSNFISKIRVDYESIHFKCLTITIHRRSTALPPAKQVLGSGFTNPKSNIPDFDQPDDFDRSELRITNFHQKLSAASAIKQMQVFEFCPTDLESQTFGNELRFVLRRLLEIRVLADVELKDREDFTPEKDWLNKPLFEQHDDMLT